MVGQGQDVFQRPELIGAKGPPFAAVDKIGREFAGAEKWEFGVGIDEEFTIFAIQINPHQCPHGGGVDPDFADASHEECGIAPEIQDVQKIRRTHGDAAGGRAITDVVEHGQEVGVGRGKVVCAVTRNLIQREDASFDHQCATEHDFTAMEIILPGGGEGQQQGRWCAIGCAAQIVGGLHIGQAAGAALFLLIFLFAQRIGGAAQHGERQSDGVGADETLFAVGVAGAFIFDHAAVADFGLGSQFTGAPREDAFEPGRLVIGAQHTATLDQRVSFLKNGRSAPVLDRDLCQFERHGVCRSAWKGG